MLCRRCGKEVGDIVIVCNVCLEDFARMIEEPLDEIIEDEIAEEQAEHSEEEIEILPPLRLLIKRVLVPVVCTIFAITILVSLSGVINANLVDIGLIRKKRINVQDKVRNVRPTKKISFEIGEGGVHGIVSVGNTDVPVWDHSISLRLPERAIVVKFAQREDSAESRMRPASQTFTGPLILKLRFRPRTRIASVETLAGYTVIFNYGKSKIRIDRLSPIDSPVHSDLDGLSGEVRLGGKIKAMLVAQLLPEETSFELPIALDLRINGLIETLE